MNGVILVDKPTGWTSHDVVNRMRRILGQRSIGHLGTLDPLATGVLPLVTGSLTRLAQFYISSEKTYQGVIRFGFATDTYDADGQAFEEKTELADSLLGRPFDLQLDALRKVAAEFLGVMEQVPPPFSAKKIHGVPAYKFARKKTEVILRPVQVEVKELDILSVAGERAHFRARVSSGTYMRSIAHEMGQRLGCGAHLESLRRTSVAEFDIAQAHTLEEIEATVTTESASPSRSLVLAGHAHDENSYSPKGQGSAMQELPASFTEASVTALFVHPRHLLPQFPSVTADEAAALRIRTGRPVNLAELSRARLVKVFYGHANLIAIATRVAGTLFHPKIVFPA